ncbi:porin family protein [Mucilaginibacter sp. RCC_168]|uniref:porin family protein n=1 Tax=unclassified Mucilaginibacter TaxID=2617802 RepID=UPI003523E8AA
MKKFIFFAICLFAAGAASAQNYNGPYRRPPRRYVRHEQRRPYNENQIKVGFTAGLNVANSLDAYDSRFSSNSIAAFNVGLTLDVPVTNYFSFAPEVLFSQKGYSADLENAHFTERTNYIDVPLLAKFKIVPGFNFLIGPQLTFLTSQRDTYRDFGTNVETRYDGHEGDQSYVAGVVGLSFDINRNVEIRGRYNIDLSRNSSNEADLPDFRNQVWQIGLGFKFQ